MTYLHVINTFCASQHPKIKTTIYFQHLKIQLEFWVEKRGKIKGPVNV